MQRTRIWVRTFLVPLLGAFSLIVLDTYPVQAGDIESTRTLVGLVGNDSVEKWNEAAGLYSSISGNSTFKPVATQAMALIEIRQGNYSEAWKLLSAQLSNLSSAPIAYRLGHEKLILWLLLEANSVDKAESQFKRLVTIAIDKDLPDPERRDLCHFLGGVIGICRSGSALPRIEETTLEKGKIAVEKLESKLAVEQFKIELHASEEWSLAVKEKVTELSNVDPDSIQVVLNALQKDVDNAVKRKAKAKENLEAKWKSKTAIEYEKKQLLAKQDGLENALEIPTPRKPRKPSRSSGSRPQKSSEVYKIDSKTGQPTSDSKANARNEQEYREDLRDYEQGLRRNESEMDTYERRLEEWKRVDAARRDQLQRQKQSVDDALNAKQPEVAAAQEAFKAHVALSKQLDESVKQMQRTLAIATIAARNLSLPNPTQSLIRPSDFQILNFESEAFRLQKCLRESNR